MTFQTMRLVEPVARAIEDEGYDTPTPIQAQTIPEAMTGRDVLGCAQTGTGKTCAFALPILHQLASSDEEYQMPRKARRGRPPRALVLCPTRELAMQIHESFETYGRHLELRHAVIYGGVKQGRQVNALRYGVDVLIATPGRLLDLVNQGHVDLSEIQSFVLDEADRMLDMGFIDDIRKVVDMIPNTHQTLFFSATVSNDIRRLADSLLKDPLKVETAPEATTVDKIDQCVYMVKRDDKPQALCALLERDSVECALVFTKTKHGADRLVRHLRGSKYRSDAIHSDKNQNRRIDIMNAFRSGRISVLVATDIAARGIDVDGITHVVNYDLPMESETYVHRIGRTARAGASGIAITFCDKSERRLLKNVERRTRKPLKVATDLDIPKRVEKKKNFDNSPSGRYEEKQKRFDEKFDRKLAKKFGPGESASDSYGKRDKQDWKKDKKKDWKKDKKKFKKNFDGRREDTAHGADRDHQEKKAYKPSTKPPKWAPRKEGDAPNWKPAPKTDSRDRNEGPDFRVDRTGNPWQKKNAQKPGNKKSWDGKKGNKKSNKWSEGPKPKRYGQVSNREDRSESGDRQPWEKSYQKGGKPGWKSKHPYNKGEKRNRDGESVGSRDARDGDRGGNKPWTPKPKPKSQGVPWKPKNKFKSSNGKSAGYGDRHERSERSDRSDRPSRPARGGSKPWSEGTRGNATRKPKSGAPKHQWKKPKGEYGSDRDRDERSQGGHDGTARKSGQGKWKPGGFKSGAKPGGFKSGAKPRGAKPARSKSGGFKPSNGKPGGFKSGGPKRGGTTNRYSTASRNRTSGRGVRG